MIEIKVTEQQRNNLKKLADYLAALPTDYNHFDMRNYNGNGYKPNQKEAENVCGTIACAAGHGPAAGIIALSIMGWGEYVKEKFTNGDCSLYNWLFSNCWEFVDNTPHGAAKRIYYFLDNGGIPDDYR